MRQSSSVAPTDHRDRPCLPRVTDQGFEAGNERLGRAIRGGLAAGRRSEHMADQ
jgi:hypothetical protein